MELPNQDKMRTPREKETYKYLGILEADTIKQVEMKEIIKKEYHRRTRKQPETKLCCRNLIKGTNTWAILFVKFQGPFLKWTKEKLKQMNPKKKKKKINGHASGITSQKWRWPTICIKKGGRKRTCQHWRHIDITTGGLHRKARRRTDYSHQKQYWQHEDQQNDNHLKTKIGRKTNLWAS